MTVIEVALPDEVDKAIELLSADKEKFILQAVSEKLKDTKLELIKEQLIEDYKSSFDENAVLLEDYKHVDLEHWDDY